MRIQRFLIVFVALLGASIASHAAPEIEAQGGPRSAVRVARVSPDGTRLATLDGRLLQLWTRKGGVLWSRCVSGDARALAWAPDGKRLAVGFGGTAGFFVGKPGDSAGAVELNASDGKPLRTLLAGNNTVFDLAYLRDGRLVMQSDDSRVIWDAAGAKTPLKSDFNVGVFPSPDGNRVAVLTNGVQLWKPDLSAKIASLWRKGMPAGAFIWARDNRHFAVADSSHVQIWDANRRALEREIALPAGAAPSEFDSLALSWTPDSRTVVLARTDFPDYKTVENQSPEAGRPRLCLARIERASGALTALRAGERRALASLDFWPDGTLIWGGGTGDDPQIWGGDLNFMRLQPRAVAALWRAPQPLEAPRDLQISPDGATLAIGGDDTAIRLWNLKSGRLEKSLKVVSSAILALRWSPSGEQIAALDYDNLFVFDVASGKARKFKGTPIYDEAASIAWSPDGKQIAFDGGEGVEILDVASGKTRAIEPPKSANEDESSSIYGPLRWTNAGLEASGGLELDDPKTGRTLRRLDGRGVASEKAPGVITDAFAWFDEGRGLLTLGGDDELSSDGEIMSVKRWDVAANRVERTLRFDFNPLALAIAPDETAFAVGGDGGQIALFDRKTLETRWTANVGGAIRKLCWSGAGDTLFAACDDGWTYVIGSDGKLRGQSAALPAPAPLSTGYEWIDLTPDARYVASAKAAPLLRWREDGELRALDTFGAKTDKLPLAQIAPPKIAVGLKPEIASAPEVLKSPEKTATGQPTLVLQGTTAGQFRAVAVSSGARWIVTHNEDQSVMLWDGRENLAWGELKSLRDRVPLFFSPDGKLLFGAPTKYPGDGEIYQSLEVHRIPNGELVRSFALQSPYWSDGKWVRGIRNGAVETYDLSDGKRIAAQKIVGLPTDNNRLAFSPAGNLLVAGAGAESSHAARVWRVSDGAKVAEIADKQRIIGALAAVSSDGRYLATEGEDPKWSPPTDGPMTESAYARTFQLHLWNARTKKLLFSYDGYYSLSGGVQLLRFSPDGKALFSAGKDGDLRRLDTDMGRVAALPPTPKDELSLLDWPIALSPDAKNGAGSTRDYALATVDVATRQLKQSFAGILDAPDEAFWSPDGKYIFGAGAIFDAHSGALLSQLKAYGKEPFWRDGELWTANSNGVARWSLPDLKKLDDWQIAPSTNQNGPGGYSDGVRLAPDGTKALTGDPKGIFGGGKSGLWVWDAQTHKTLRTLIPDFDPRSDLEALVFFPDGQKILRPTKSGMEEWDLNSGEKLREWRDPVATNYKATEPFSAALLPLAVAPNSKLIAARANRNNTIWIFDADDQTPPLQLLVRANYSTQFLKDGRTLLLQNGAQWQLWDARGDGKTPLRTLRATGDKMHLSPDEKLASFGSYNTGGLQIWNLARDAEVARLFTVREKRNGPINGWIALTPAGFYDASPAGEARLRWREGDAFWPLEKSRALFFAPDKVRAALNP